MNSIDNKALLERFLSYVAIDSETGDEKEMGEKLVLDFEAIGCDVYTDEIKDVAQTTGFNVYATLKGEPDLEPIMFSAHMDTVVPGCKVKATVCDDGFVRSDGTTILGGDDKAGISAIVEAMKAARDVSHRTVEAIITVREESGMHGAKNLEYSKIKSKKCIVLDSSGGPCDVISSAPGQNKITATVIGRKAHAGIEPETGISAIEVAAHAVANMKLLRVDFETTCNIGTFTAVGPTNIVADKVLLEIEVRSRNTGKLKEHTKHILDCIKEACEKFDTKFESKVETSYLGYHIPDEHLLIKEIALAAEKIGLKTETKTSGGGSDANIFNQNNIEAINLGIGIQKVHTNSEQLCIKDMQDASALCLELMKG